MASFLESVGNIFSSGHSGRVVGIDIGSSSIKVVELEKIDEQAVLKNYAEIAIGPLAGSAVGQATNLSPEKIAEALRDVFHEAGIEPRHTSLTIPISSSLISVIELPNVSKRELETMIPLEARKYIPLPISEVSLDWWILPREKEEKKASQDGGAPAPLGKIEAVIAAIHNEVLSRYETIRQIAQIPSKTSHMEIEIFSTLRSLVGRDLTPTLVVDVGAGMTKVVIIDNGAMRGSHTISMGGQDITLALAKSLGISFAQAEEIKCRAGMLGDAEGRDVRAVSELLLSNIFNEALRFVDNYEQRRGSRIQKIVFTGGGVRLKGLDKVATEKFSSRMQVVWGDPFSRLDTPAFLEPTLKELNPNFATAIGVALKGFEE